MYSKDYQYSLEIMQQELNNKYICPEVKYAFEASIEALKQLIAKRKIKSCTLDEMKDAINEGKKIVVYGDMVIYDINSKLEPHKWYRDKIREADIAVNVEILEE